MPLSHFTHQLIEMKCEKFRTRIAAHEDGTMTLIPTDLEDYKNDLAILELLLSGIYEKGYCAIMNKDIRTMANIAERRGD